MQSQFPVQWRSDEQELFWFWDQSHWPLPTTPLSATLELPAMAAGFSRAARTLSRPFGDYHLKVVNGFVYFGFDLRDPAARALRAERCAALLAERIPTVSRFWIDEVLPEVQRINLRWQTTGWDQLADAELAGEIPAIADERTRQWELHDLVLPPTMAALDQFLSIYAQHFPNSPPTAAHALTRGLPNKSVETARELWKLAHHQEIRSWLDAGTPEPPPAALAAHLDVYGWRTDGWELSDPALREAPAPLISRLRRYTDRRHPDPDQELARAAQERERLLGEALARLQGDDREQFQAAHAAACMYPVLSEDHNFSIDQMGMASLRVPLLAMGRRLVGRGAIATPDDVFFLLLDELERGLRTGEGDLKDRVVARRAERLRWQATQPPATIGASLPEDLAGDAVIAGFFGVGAEPKRGERVLRGVAGAPGVVSGPARIVRSLADTERLEPGDVLVCPMTSPAWTPVFATVAAVVADAGGALSHTAIVAREYGLPCVVATRVACRDLTEGEWIEVDGDHGEVRRVSTA